jgi:hypothetical protein
MARLCAQVLNATLRARGKVSFIRVRFDAGMPPETESDAVRASMQQIGCTVEIARRLVEGGKQVDLAGLDSQMGFVCARALDLPPEEGRALRPALLELLQAVDALSAALMARAPPDS